MTELHLHNGQAPSVSPAADAGRPNVYQALLGSARDILALQGGARVVVTDANGLTVTVAADSPSLAPPRQPPFRPSAAFGSRLQKIHKKLLATASPTDPVTAKKLIGLAGYEDNSYSRAALTHLARQRLLLRTPDGYLREQRATAPAPTSIPDL